jgi:hypothetical protein
MTDSYGREPRYTRNRFVHDARPRRGEECWVGVRATSTTILLAVSRQNDGDIEISLTTADAKRLAKALS